MICWIRPFTGLAGDMLLGALLDAGADPAAVRRAVTATGLTGWRLTAERVVTHGLAATTVHVEVTDSATHRPAAELIRMAALAGPPPVADMAVAALTAVARAEARLHGTTPDRVHLHELGGHDSLVDIVGVSAALHDLGVRQVVCDPLPLAPGHVTSAHGRIPCPAPATLALLDGAATTGTDLTGETVTPTGAALLHAAGARYAPPPPMTLGPTGYGAGTRVLPDRPNVTAVTLGTPAGAPAPPREPVVLLETTVDDVTGETLAYTLERALALGALDAWIAPVVMKKSRPGHVLHVLARPADEDRLERLLFAETGTLGVRRVAAGRAALPRRTDRVEVDGVTVRVKTGPHGAKPEHDDTAALAARLGVPLRAAAARILAAHRAARTDPSPEAGRDR